MENVKLTPLQKNLFVLSLIVGLLEERLKTRIIKTLRHWLILVEKVWRRWSMIIISLAYLLIFVGAFHILPTSPFRTCDDIYGDKSKMLISAMIALLITTNIIVKKGEHQKIRCIIVLFSLCIILCVLVVKELFIINR